MRSRVDDGMFQRLVTHVRTFGYTGFFYKRAITYLDEAGLVYWTMGAPLKETIIVNRCRKEDSFEYRASNGTLPRVSS